MAEFPTNSMLKDEIEKKSFRKSDRKKIKSICVNLLNL
jgi:hypothetical protein